MNLATKRGSCAAWFLGLFLLLGHVLYPQKAEAAGNAEICARAEADNRLGEMTLTQCTCLLTQGDRRMDARLAQLWKRALLTGDSQVEAVRALGIPERRMERQMRRTLSDARKRCGVSNPFGF